MRLFSYAKRAFSLRGSVRMASMASKEAPYGSWASPFTAKFITSSSTGLSNVKVDAEGGLWWQESRPNEGEQLLSSGSVAARRKENYNADLFGLSSAALDEDTNIGTVSIQPVR